jgi:hypothetical protein
VDVAVPHRIFFCGTWLYHFAYQSLSQVTMALFGKRYGGYGRDDKPPVWQTILKGDSIFVRIGAFIICALLYYAILRMTHKETATPDSKPDTVVTAPKKTK